MRHARYLVWSLGLLSLTPFLLGASGLASEALRAEAEAILAARFPGEAERLRVRVLRTGGAAAEAPPVRLAFPPSPDVPRGHTQVDVLTPRDGRWQKTGWALLYVAHFDSVVVAQRSVPRGAAVAPADLSTAWMETTSFHGPPLRAADLRAFGAEPLHARRPLRAGRALRRGDLRPPYAADTGDTVVMRYQRGALLVELPCRAREPGFVGDEIRLHGASTGATYRARLTGPGTATWTATL